MIKKFKETVIINQGLQIPITERFKTNENGGFFYITNEFLKDGKDKYYIQNAPKSVICNKNDILMTRTGNTGMVVSNVEGVFHNNFFKIEYKENYDRLFLIQLLRSTYIQRKIKSLCGVSTIPDLNHGDFYSIEHDVPSLDKQKQIGNFLSNVDKLIESKREEIKLKEEYKKGIIQKIFNKEIRFKDEDGNYYPEWEEKRLSQVGLIVTGFTPKTSESHLWDGELNFITPTDIKGKYQYKTERKVSKIDRVNKLIIPKGSIIYTCIASIGKMTITQDECITNQQINSIIPFENFNNEFIYYTLLFNEKKIRSNASSFGMAMINKNDFSKFIFQFPSLQEQNKITDFISLIDIELNTLNNELYKYFQMKKKLLTIIFSFDKGCYDFK